MPGLRRLPAATALVFLAAMAAQAYAQGTGLRGEYYDNREFDGVNDFMALAANLAPVLGNTGAVAAWVRTVGLGQVQPYNSGGIIGVEEPGTGNDIYYGWVTPSGGLGVRTGDVPAPPPKIETGPPVRDGQWHHVVFTRSSPATQLRSYNQAGNPFTWSSGALPGTLSLNAAGELSSAGAMAAGTYYFVVTATDSVLLNTASGRIRLVIAP